MNSPKYFHQIVNNLHWCIASSPLMLSHPAGIYKTLDEAWFTEMLELHKEWLFDLDADPERLKQHLTTEKKLPLGKQFERYISFWLKESPCFSLLAENVQLIGDKTTVGEIDFLFKETRSGRVFHMEVACKFYLGHRNSPNWEQWIGPNGNDTLRLKMDKLDKQLAVTTTKEGAAYLQTSRIPKPEPVLLMKGFFFHHFKSLTKHRPPQMSSPKYAAGWWVRRSELKEVFQRGGSWVVLPKSDWLSVFHTNLTDDQILSGSEAVAVSDDWLKQKKRALMVIQVFPGGMGWEEASRGMVVTDYWPNRG